MPPNLTPPQIIIPIAPEEPHLSPFFASRTAQRHRPGSLYQYV